MTTLKSHFLLDPSVTFLNHGSFGACPKPVFQAYQHWQQMLERQPVYFINQTLLPALAQAREALAEFIHASPEDIVYVPNATFAVNIIARSLPLEPGDELLTTDHEYGACDNVWEFMRRKRGFTIVRQPVTLPVTSQEEIVAQIWQGVTSRTRAIFLSHITSSTAMILPVAEICHRAREAGIWCIVDGAHTVGQVPLDMAQIGADFYTSNNHKWLLSPKGSAFLYARREVQPLLEPLVVGWGWGENRVLSGGSDFLDYHQWLGTNDLSAYLATPEAIVFQRQWQWEAVVERCHLLAKEALARIGALTGVPPLYPATADFFRQMFVAPLPSVDEGWLKEALYQQFAIEVPVFAWHGRSLIRVSVQGYNTPEDVDRLIAALAVLLNG
ncbi:MAG: aminotransferase class V-fold PLP-dependent enzyme [Candidatus Promineifilaceae bacterium]